MDEVSACADAGAAEGLVVVAHEQTAGRGRRGRTWSSPPGAGLYLSFLFTPRPDQVSPRALGLVTLGAGVAVRAAVRAASGFAPELKWPNDVMVGRRKLAGVLAEGMGLGGSHPRVVLGVGVNVRKASYPPEVADRATSVEEETGRPIDAAPILEALLLEVPAVYARLGAGEADAILRSWREASPAVVGATVEWDTPQGVRQGTTIGIDDDGALVVGTGTTVERVVGGEVRWR